MTAAREAILARIAAVPRSAAAPVPRDYRRTGMLDEAARVELFCERVGEYRAEVHRGLETLASLEGRFVVPASLPQAWRPRGAVEDDDLSPRELDAVDGVVTGCTV